MDLHRIFTIALTPLAAIPTMAQDRNNVDEVVKVDARFSAYNYREGEVIVKFKDQSAAQINAPRRTKFRTSGVNSIDATLRELGVRYYPLISLYPKAQRLLQPPQQAPHEVRYKDRVGLLWSAARPAW